MDVKGEWEALTFFGWIREDGRYVYLQNGMLCRREMKLT